MTLRSSLLIGVASASMASTTLLRAQTSSCVVGSLDVLDHTRTAGIPYASPADSGSAPVRVRALVWGAGRGTARVTYDSLIRAVAPGVDAAEHLTSRLRFYGATVDSAAVARAVRGPSECARVARIDIVPRGMVLVLGAFPPVLYEGAAALLAERGIATVAMSGTESAARLVLNHLAALGWPVDRVVVVGHGAGGPVAAMLAMGSSGVRGLVSLDGFEALDARRHPGLTGDPAWRPGNLRAPILHWRPTGHPDADTLFHARAARSALLQLTLTGVRGQQFLAAPELSLAPRALRPLIAGVGAATQDSIVRLTAAFIEGALLSPSRSASAMASVAAGTAEAGGRAFSATYRAALPAPAIRTDGRLDERVWSTARTLSDSSIVSVRVTDDCEYLYAAVVPRRIAPFITELFIAPATDEALSASTLLLHASASLCWAYGKADVAPTDCNKSESWWGGSRTNQVGDPPVGECAIAKRALGLARCTPITGLRIGALIGGWGPSRTYPATADKLRPTSWARIP